MNSINCETCTGKEFAIKANLINLLQSGQIDPTEFLLSSNQEKYRLVKCAFRLDELPFKQDLKIKEDCKFDGLGVVVIKPEALQNFENLILKYLENELDLEIVYTREFIYTPEEYWILQGRDLENISNVFPEGVLLWLLSVTNESKIVLFKHKTAEEYRQIFRKLIPTDQIDEKVQMSNDQQYVFTELFIRSDSNASIRKGICAPELEKRGFGDMDPGKCPASCWDVTGDFGKRTSKDNTRAFNGIHSPKDQHELISDLVILSRLFD